MLDEFLSSKSTRPLSDGSRLWRISSLSRTSQESVDNLKDVLRFYKSPKNLLGVGGGRNLGKKLISEQLSSEEKQADSSSGHNSTEHW